MNITSIISFPPAKKNYEVKKYRLEISILHIFDEMNLNRKCSSNNFFTQKLVLY